MKILLDIIPFSLMLMGAYITVPKFIRVRRARKRLEKAKKRAA